MNGLGDNYVDKHRRRRGLYPEQLEQWRHDCEQAASLSHSERQREADELKQQRKLIKALEILDTCHRPDYAHLPPEQIVVRLFGEEARYLASPSQRHARQDTDILMKRDQINRTARNTHPARWSGRTRNWTPVKTVSLNPERELSVMGNKPEKKAA